MTPIKVLDPATHSELHLMRRMAEQLDRIELARAVLQVGSKSDGIRARMFALKINTDLMQVFIEEAIDERIREAEEAARSMVEYEMKEEAIEDGA